MAADRLRDNQSVIDVILDTNILMSIFQLKINIESELDRLLGKYRIIVPSSVISELENLSKKHRIAKTALKFSERYEIINVDKRGDEALIEIVSDAKKKTIIVTNDRELRKKLNTMNVPVIYVRSSSHLDIFY
ncbi:MAG: PIN domain-containing protein [Thermoplasmata archaeon]